MENDLTAPLERLVAWVESSEEATRYWRERAERDRDYYDGIQLTQREREILEKRGQPPVVINRIKGKVDYLTGLEKQQRTDPKAFSRTPQDAEVAEAATDAIRYVEEAEDFDRIRSSVWENMLVEGTGGVEIQMVQRRGKLEVSLIQVPWDRLIVDPASSQPNYSDSRYMGSFAWLDFDEAVDKYPNAAGHFESMKGAHHDTEDTYEDKPKEGGWFFSKRDRVRIAQLYYRDKGQWRWAIFTKGLLIDSGDVPYVDDDGVSLCPMELVSGYVTRDNERYGIIRDMIDPQDEVNKRRSKMLHQLTMRQIRADKGAFVDGVNYARKELAKPDGVVETVPGFTFDILPQGDQVAGQATLLQHATAELDNMGPNASMQGLGDERQSGRAIIAQQQGGMIAITTLLDHLRGFNKRVYRQIWWRVKQYWTEERWIRVTDDENRPRHVGLNQPITLADAFREQLIAEGTPEDVVDQEMAQFREYPDMDQIVEVRNQVGEIDVDIVLEDVPDVVTIQSEQFDQIVALASTGAVQFPPDLWIEMAPGLRNKRELLDRLKGEGDDPQAGQQQAALQEQALALEMAEKTATIENIEAQAAEREAKAIKTTVETQLL